MWYRPINARINSDAREVESSQFEANREFLCAEFLRYFRSNYFLRKLERLMSSPIQDPPIQEKIDSANATLFHLLEEPAALSMAKPISILSSSANFPRSPNKWIPSFHNPANSVLITSNLPFLSIITLAWPLLSVPNSKKFK